tara:strand:- start:1204 stop:1620 length:417 start_codon:yes stop_codon:yes gene_type:complete
MALNTKAQVPQPRRPNFTDIRSMVIWDPKVIGYQSVVPAEWRRLNSSGATSSPQAWAIANGATLENGVRIKNVTNTNVWVTTDSAGTSADMPIRVPAGATTGFVLAEREEVFLEVRQLGHVWVTTDLAAGATISIIAS